MTTFQAPCGCLASLDGDENVVCPIHEIEGVTPIEALGVFLRGVLGGEDEATALAAIRAVRSKDTSSSQSGPETQP